MKLQNYAEPQTNKPDVLQFVFLAQIAGCVLVIIGHSYPFTVAIPSWAEHIRTFVYCFHMPLFVWCSGFLLAYTDVSRKYSFSKFVKKRAARIIVPYLIFSSIGIIPKILFANVLNDTLSWNITELVRAFLVPRENIWGHFWFLPMIFLLGVVGYWIVKCASILHGEWILIGLTIVGVALLFLPNTTSWLGVNDIRNNFVYFMLGVLSTRILKHGLKTQHTFDAYSCIVISCITFVILEKSILRGLIIAVLMIYAIVRLCMKIGVKTNVSRKMLIARTYSIFILSWPCQLVVEVLLERYLNLPFGIVTPTMLFAGIVGPLVILKTIDWIEIKTHTHIMTTILGEKR